MNGYLAAACCCKPPAQDQAMNCSGLDATTPITLSASGWDYWSASIHGVLRLVHGTFSHTGPLAPPTFSYWGAAEHRIPSERISCVNCEPLDPAGAPLLVTGVFVRCLQ